MFDGEDSSSKEKQRGDVLKRDDHTLLEHPLRVQPAMREAYGRDELIIDAMAEAQPHEAFREGPPKQLALDAKKDIMTSKAATCPTCGASFKSEVALSEHHAIEQLCLHCPERLIGKPALDVPPGTHQHFEPTAPYLFEAIQEATAYARQVTNDMTQREQQKRQLRQMRAAHSHRQLQLLQDKQRILNQETERLRLRMEERRAGWRARGETAGLRCRCEGRADSCTTKRTKISLSN